MTKQEHVVAVVDPSLEEDTTLEIAQQVADRGGRVTVMVLASRDTVAGVNAFADAENLTVPDAKEIYLERLAIQYTERFGGQEAPAILTATDGSPFVFGTAARAEATVVAMPQRLARKRGWRKSVANSPIPVVIAPEKAA